MVLSNSFLRLKDAAADSRLFLGNTGDMGLIMTSYKPSVYCRSGPKPPSFARCKSVVDSMMTSKVLKVFGKSGDPRATIGLPKTLSGGQ